MEIEQPAAPTSQLGNPPEAGSSPQSHLVKDEPWPSKGETPIPELSSLCTSLPLPGSKERQGRESPRKGDTARVAWKAPDSASDEKMLRARQVPRLPALCPSAASKSTSRCVEMPQIKLIRRRAIMLVCQPGQVALHRTGARAGLQPDDAGAPPPPAPGPHPGPEP